MCSIEVAPALLLGHREALVVPELRQPLADRLALRDLVEIAERQLVLGLDPGVRVGRVRVFQPAVGIGDLRAVIVVDLIDRLRLRIIQPAPSVCAVSDAAATKKSATKKVAGRSFFIRIPLAEYAFESTKTLLLTHPRKRQEQNPQPALITNVKTPDSGLHPRRHVIPTVY